MFKILIKKKSNIIKNLIDKKDINSERNNPIC